MVVGLNLSFCPERDYNMLVLTGSHGTISTYCGIGLDRAGMARTADIMDSVEFLCCD